MNYITVNAAPRSVCQCNQHGALNRRVRRVLDLDPFAAASRAVAAVAPLGDDALQPHDAGLPKHDRAIDVLDMLIEPDASIGVGE
jgi:hypothetical protein